MPLSDFKISDVSRVYRLGRNLPLESISRDDTQRKHIRHFCRRWSVTSRWTSKNKDFFMEAFPKATFNDAIYEFGLNSAISPLLIHTGNILVLQDKNQLIFTFSSTHMFNAGDRRLMRGYVLDVEEDNLNCFMVTCALKNKKVRFIS